MGDWDGPKKSVIAKLWYVGSASGAAEEQGAGAEMDADDEAERDSERDDAATATGARGMTAVSTALRIVEEAGRTEAELMIEECEVEDAALAAIFFELDFASS